MKKNTKTLITALFLSLTLALPSFALATDITLCDYDEYESGSLSLELTGDKYKMVLNSEIETMTYEGPAGSPVVKQAQDALKSLQKNSSTYVLLRRSAPICVVNAQFQRLYISSVIEKDDYYGVTVGVPETDHIWVMTIEKNSQLGGAIRFDKDAIEDVLGKVCHVTSNGNTIIDLFAAQ